MKYVAFQCSTKSVVCVDTHTHHACEPAMQCACVCFLSLVAVEYEHLYTQCEDFTFIVD